MPILKGILVIKRIAVFTLAGAAMLYADTSKPPVLTDAQKNAFHTAQAIKISSAAQAADWLRKSREDDAAFHRVADPMCGEGFTWQTDEKDDVSCIEAPKPVTNQDGRMPIRKYPKPQ